MMPEETLFRVGARTARVLAPGADEPRVQRLCEACRDYYELNAGTPPSASAARDLFTAGPPSARPEDKLVLGVFEAPGDGSVRGGRLVGLIEGFRGYPEAGAWWLGLVLLHPDERGRGLGAALVEAFVAGARRPLPVARRDGAERESPQVLARPGVRVRPAHGRDPGW